MRYGDGVGDTLQLSSVDIADRERGELSSAWHGNHIGFGRSRHAPRSSAIGHYDGLPSAPLAGSRPRAAKSIREGRFSTDHADTPSLTMCYSQISRRLLRDKEYTLILPIHRPREASRFNGCCAERCREPVVHPHELVLAHPAQ